MALVACGASEEPTISEPTDVPLQQPSSDAAVEPTPTLAPTALPQPTATAIPPTDEPEPDPTAAPVEEAAEEAEAAGESEPAAATESDSAESSSAPIAAATAEPTAQPDIVFPASNAREAYVLRDGDHYKGAAEPDVLIIEYGDFQ